MVHRVARQVLGQRLARRRRPLGGGSRRRARLRLARLQVLDDQLELIELLDALGELLRGAAELHASQSPDLQLQLLDPGAQVQALCLRVLEPRLALLDQRLLLDHQALGRLDLIRQVLDRGAHACNLTKRIAACVGGG